MGSGGTNGAVSFPKYVEDIHGLYLAGTRIDDDGNLITTPVQPYYDLEEVTTEAWENNPYAVFDVTNPLGFFSSGEGKLNDTYDLVEGLDEQEDWSNAIDQAVAKVSSATVIKDIDVSSLLSQAVLDATTTMRGAYTLAKSLTNTTAISTLVAEFENRNKIGRARARAQINAQMSDVNAVHGSAYLLSHALLESEFQRETSEYNAQISLGLMEQIIQGFVQTYVQTHRTNSFVAQKNKDNREAMIRLGTEQMRAMLGSKIQFNQTVAETFADLGRLKAVAVGEFEDYRQKLEASKQAWNMDVIIRGMQVLAAPGGMAGQFPGGPSRVTSAIGGALGGGGSGAAIGTAINPGAGTVIGAIAGGVLGGVGGALE